MNVNATSSQSSSITTVMQNMGLDDQTGLIAASLLADASGCECEEEGNDSNSALMLMALMAGSNTVTSTVSTSSSQSISAYDSPAEQPSQLNVEA